MSRVETIESQVRELSAEDLSGFQSTYDFGGER